MIFFREPQSVLRQASPAVRRLKISLVPWFRDIGTQTYPLHMRDGGWGVPAAPGLGIEIDEAAAARHPFAQEEIPVLDVVLPDGRIANW
jgi:galactonate dehydratase